MKTQFERMQEALYKIYFNPLTPPRIKKTITDSCDLADLIPGSEIEHIECREVANGG